MAQKKSTIAGGCNIFSGLRRLYDEISRGNEYFERELDQKTTWKMENT